MVSGWPGGNVSSHPQRRRRAGASLPPVPPEPGRLPGTATLECRATLTRRRKPGPPDSGSLRSCRRRKARRSSRYHRSSTYCERGWTRLRDRPYRAGNRKKSRSRNSARIVLGHRHLEFDSITDTSVFGTLFRSLNGLVVIVESKEFGFRKRLCHQYGGRPQAAADICNRGPFFQLFFHSFECRNPGADEVGRISR